MSHSYPVTFHGIGKWTKKMFSTFGWMVLAERDGRDYKIAAYATDLAHLEQAITNKLGTIISDDRRSDLDITLSDVKELRKRFAATFHGLRSNGNATATATATQRSGVNNASQEPVAAVGGRSASRKGNGKGKGNGKSSTR